MGYTIFTRELVEPKFFTSGAINPGPRPTYPAGAGLLYRPATQDIYSSIEANRRELLTDPSGTAADATILSAFPELRTKLIDDIKAIRAQALEKATKNSGVYAVYDENYQASMAFTTGQGDTHLMRNGMTAAVYLAGFGVRLGMTAAQFAAYIISENRRVGPTSYQVEDEYLRLAYGVIPVETSVVKLLAYPIEYRSFCGL